MAFVININKVLAVELHGIKISLLKLYINKKVMIMDINIGKGLATIGVCIMGALCMKYSNGKTGIGWAMVGIFIIWVCC